MAFLVLDSIVVVSVVVITEFFWLGRVGLIWMVAGYALVMAMQVVHLMIYREEIRNG